MSAQFTELYVEVQQHYAAQMQALDEGKFVEYASTFTEDGFFVHTPGRAGARGRRQIVDELHDFHRRFAAAPVRRRHWFNQLAVTTDPDGTVRTSYYVLVVTTHPGVRIPEIAPSCTVRDVLVRRDDRLLNASRIVDFDHRR